MEENIKKPVKITITGVHAPITEGIDVAGDIGDKKKSDVEGGSDLIDKTEEVSYGFLSAKNGSIYLVYEKKKDDGIIIKNLIKLMPKDKEIKRTATLHKGTVTSPASGISYTEGSVQKGFYMTNYGRLDIETMTGRIDFSECRTGITCTASGTLNINNSPASSFELKIEAVYV